MRLGLTPILCVLCLLPSLARAQASVQVAVPGVHVAVGPPPPRVEVRSVAPSPHHVWLAGHWAWHRRRHVWVPGFWAVPPAAGYVWVEPRWVPEGSQWVYYEGQWGAPAVVTPGVIYEPPPPQPIEVMVAPPPPIVEVRPALPFGGAVWIPGYWHWGGARYVWVGGRWSAPRPGFAWVEPRWQHAGPHWQFVPGHWRRG
jgi:hypothetical protein